MISAIAVAAACAVSTSPPAVADPAVAPTSGSFVVSGAGFGHGWGMSQYGAYGAARSGLTWRQILSFYYPGTRQVRQATGTTIKVWITADTDADLQVLFSPGLSVSDDSGHRFAVPTATNRTWRIRRTASGYALSWRATTGAWRDQATPLTSGPWWFRSGSSVVKVVLPGGRTRQLRGRVGLVPRGTGARTVNSLGMEDYVRGVVPAEMPTSWLPDAVRAQAVAARSYAARLQARARAGTGYDVCDTSSCQVYRGYAAETARGSAAVAATDRTVLAYGKTIALTQFASSNGGSSARGDFPYLVAQPDPYDGVVASSAWTRTVSAATLSRLWPQAGTVRQLKVSARDGSGRWGGRVTTVTIVGSRSEVRVSGGVFASRLRLRSRLFTVTGASPGPGTPRPDDRSFPRTYSPASRADLLVVTGAGRLLRYPAGPSGLGKPAVLATGFARYTHVVNAGDYNGDGHQDVIARTRPGRLLLFRGRGSGGLAAPVDMGHRVDVRSLAGIGDATGDGRPDLVLLTPAGNVLLCSGNGSAGWTRTRKIASWPTGDSLRAPGDVDGDGRVDLLSRDGGRLLLHRGTKSGFARAVSLGTGWDKLAAATSIGDVDGDGHADVIGRTRTGGVLFYRGDGHGHLAKAVRLSGRLTGTRFAS